MSSRKSRESKRSRSRSPVPTKIKSKCLLISNVPFTTTFNELKDLFKEKIGICGKLEMIERNGKFSGNATMEFKTLDGAQKAVDNLHKYELNGREIIVREESNKDRERLNIGSRSQAESAPMIQPSTGLSQLVRDLERDGTITNSLFIANLDYSITWQKLKDVFKNAGRVRRVELKTDVEGKSRGFGTVEFETPEEAVLALHLLNNKVVNNREIRLRMDKSGKALNGRLDLSRYMERENSNSHNLNPPLKNLLEDLLSASSNPNRKNPQALKALGDLMSLAKMFEKPNEPRSVSGMPEFDRSFGFGEMSSRGYDFGNDGYPPQSYDSPYYGERSMMGGSRQSGGGSYGDYNRGREYPPPSRNVDYNESSRSNGNYDMSTVEEMLIKMKSSGNLDQHSLMNVIANVMKRSPDNFSNSRISDDFLPNKQSNTLLIKNIPFSYTWKDLKVSFSQVPGIEHVEILRDDFNRSKGVGLARFESSTDAVRCKNLMDGTLLDGRPIHIEFNNSF